MNTLEKGLRRRDFLVASGVAALAVGPGTASARELEGAAYPDLALSAMHCSATGTACANHCMADLRSGSMTLVECLDRVQNLVAACDALAKLAAYGSPQLAAFAAATADVCKYCEAECRKHEGHHVPCGECADACVECARECERYLKSA